MRKWLIFMMIAGVFSTAPATADSSERSDHDDVRASVATGKRLSLSQILMRIEQTHGGRVLEIESDRENGRDLYEIELLDEQGRVIELEVDAITGDLLETEYDD